MDDFESIYLHPGHHVGYYPGAQAIHLKLIFRKSDGLVLGAQAVGEEGVARRIDVIAIRNSNESYTSSIWKSRNSATRLSTAQRKIR